MDLDVSSEYLDFISTAEKSRYDQRNRNTADELKKVAGELSKAKEEQAERQRLLADELSKAKAEQAKRQQALADEQAELAIQQTKLDERVAECAARESTNNKDFADKVKNLEDWKAHLSEALGPLRGDVTSDASMSGLHTQLTSLRDSRIEMHDKVMGELRSAEEEASKRQEALKRGFDQLLAASGKGLSSGRKDLEAVGNELAHRVKRVRLNTVGSGLLNIGLAESLRQETQAVGDRIGRVRDGVEELKTLLQDSADQVTRATSGFLQETAFSQAMKEAAAGVKQAVKESAREVKTTAEEVAVLKMKLLEARQREEQALDQNMAMKHVEDDLVDNLEHTTRLLSEATRAKEEAEARAEASEKLSDEKKLEADMVTERFNEATCAKIKAQDQAKTLRRRLGDIRAEAGHLAQRFSEASQAKDKAEARVGELQSLLDAGSKEAEQLQVQLSEVAEAKQRAEARVKELSSLSGANKAEGEQLKRQLSEVVEASKKAEAHAESRIGEVQSLLDVESSKAQQLQQQLSEVTEANKTADACIGDLQKLAEAGKGQIQHLEQQLSEAIQAKDEAAQRAKDLDSTLATNKETIARLEKSLADANQGKHSAECQVEQLRLDQSAARQAAVGREQELQNQADAESRRAQEANALAGQQSSMLKSKEKDFADLRGVLASAEERAADVQTQLCAMKEELAQVHKSAQSSTDVEAGAKVEVVNLRLEVAARNSRIAELTSERDHREWAVTELESRVQARDQDIDRLESRIASKDETIRLRDEDAAALNSHISARAKDWEKAQFFLDHYEDTVHDLRTQLADKDAALEELQTLASTRSDELAEKDHTVTKQQDRIGSLQDDARQRHAELAELERSVHARDEQIDMLASSLESKRLNFEIKDKELHDVRQALAAMQKEAAQSLKNKEDELACSYKNAEILGLAIDAKDKGCQKLKRDITSEKKRFKELLLQTRQLAEGTATRDKLIKSLEQRLQRAGNPPSPDVSFVASSQSAAKRAHPRGAGAQR